MKKKVDITANILKECFHESYALYEESQLEDIIVSTLKREAQAASSLLTTQSPELKKLFEVEESISDHHHTMDIVRSLHNGQEDTDPFFLFWKAGLFTTPVTACVLFLLFFHFSILDIISLSAGGIF